MLLRTFYAMVALGLAMPVSTAQSENAVPEGFPITVTIRVVDRETGDPLAGAAVEATVDKEKWEIQTDKSGTCTVKLSTAPKEYFVFEAMHQGYVVNSVSGEAKKLPTSTRPYTIRLDKGVPIGGVIVDEAGHPVEGVRVTFWLEDKQPETLTDAAGRWELSIPKAETQPAWQLQHPDFALSTTYSWIKITDELRAGQHRHVIERGLPVAGTVADEAGAPIENACVLRSFVDFDTYAALRERIASGEVQNVAITGADGRFSIFAEPDTEVMAVCAESFAPSFFLLKRDRSEHRVVLDKGRTWSGVVRNAAGEAIEGVKVRCYQWQYQVADSMMMRPYVAETDAEGRFSMPFLPASGPLRMYTRKDGFFSLDLEDSEADALPVELTLYPEAPLQGRVHDARTGAPVKAFMLDFGFSETAHPVATYYCHKPYRRSSKDGTFSIETGISLGPKPGAVWVRVWARDYYPTLIDPVWALEFASKPLEVALEPGESIVGKVLTPAGEGAKDAFAAFVHNDEKAVIQGYQIGEDYVGAPYNTAKSRADGSFRLAPSKEPGLILALHESGWAVRPVTEHAAGADIPLTAWCTLVGGVSLEGCAKNEDAYVEVRVPRQKDWGEKEPIRFNLGTTAGADGRFRIEYVPALPLKAGESRRWLLSHATDIAPKPGETLEVVLGDPHGGTVRGKVVVNDLVNPEGHFREPWHASRRFLLVARPKGADADDEYASYVPLLQEDGTFTLDRLPPGEYELTLTAHENPPENACGRGTPRARATRTFTIEAGQSEALDLDAVRLERVVTAGAKDQAPDIEGTTLDSDAAWKLSGEYAGGKPLLLVFWATWCAPCKAEIPALKELWEQYGKGERLQIIGLNLDWDKSRAIRFIASEELPWPQYNIGAWGENNPATNAYGVAYIPSNWLIDSKGRILEDRISAETLKETLKKFVR